MRRAWDNVIYTRSVMLFFAVLQKLSAGPRGSTRGTPTVVTIFVMLASFALLSISMKALPLGTAYTVWTGIGAVSAFVVGVVALGEPLAVARLPAAAFIVAGMSLMKLTTSA